MKKRCTAIKGTFKNKDFDANLQNPLITDFLRSSPIIARSSKILGLFKNLTFFL